MIALTILKVLVALVGVSLIFWFLLASIVKKDRSKLRPAGIVLISVFTLILVLTALEFGYFYLK
ncbi:Cardiolipin synthase N-terminal domain-containing protein [Pontibacter korlensis]|uniref:Uncharacterized protein n=1 Tax=Pontibacter korlensis TaxID=400092 RepID=A0A0E3UVU6_9BACT|nr:hypothetical protein PKOR_02265 [Pontibacter korlensis]